MLTRAAASLCRGTLPAWLWAGTCDGRAAQRATRITFFIAGFAMAAWAPLVPFVQARTHLPDGPLGLLLLALGGGSIVAMPFAGALVARFGCRSVIIGASGLLCVSLPLLATVSSLIWLVPALILFGAGVGTVDCVVNIHAIIVERASGRAMMSGFHGLFSLGAIAGSAGVGVLLSAGIGPLPAILCVVAGILAALLAGARHLLPTAGPGEGPALAWPRGRVLSIGALCFVGFLAEGSALDWSAVFMTSVRHVAPAHAGMGYAAFSAAMTTGRFAGDRIVRRFGGARVMAWGGVGAAAGLGCVVGVPAWQASLLGYALLGAGCANIAPVLFNAAGHQRVMPEHAAVPAIATLGYTGILAGPALIGLGAHVASLSAAFLALALLLLGVAASGRMLRDDSPQDGPGQSPGLAPSATC